MEAAETGGTKKRNKDTEESCEDKIQRTSGELSPSKQKKTVYHVDVENDHIKEVIKRLATFFKSPSFSDNSMEKEINLLHAEFAQELQNERSRHEQLISGLAKDSHPMKKFPWGNWDTLKTNPELQRIDVQAAVMGFREKHYVAQHMKLVVISNESLETLEGWVKAFWGDVPSTSDLRPDFSSLGA